MAWSGMDISRVRSASWFLSNNQSPLERLSSPAKHFIPSVCSIDVRLARDVFLRAFRMGFFPGPRLGLRTQRGRKLDRRSGRTTGPFDDWGFCNKLPQMAVSCLDARDFFGIAKYSNVFPTVSPSPTCSIRIGRTRNAFRVRFRKSSFLVEIRLLGLEARCDPRSDDRIPSFLRDPEILFPCSNEFSLL